MIKITQLDGKLPDLAMLRMTAAALGFNLEFYKNVISAQGENIALAANFIFIVFIYALNTTYFTLLITVWYYNNELCYFTKTYKK